MLGLAIKANLYRRLSASGVPKIDAYARTFGTLPNKRQTLYAPYIARIIPGTTIRHKTYGMTHVQSAIDIDGTLVHQGAIYKTPKRTLERVVLKAAAIAVGIGLGAATFKLGSYALKQLVSFNLKNALWAGASTWAMQYTPALAGKVLNSVDTSGDDLSGLVTYGYYGGLIYGGFAGKRTLKQGASAINITRFWF